MCWTFARLRIRLRSSIVFVFCMALFPIASLQAQDNNVAGSNAGDILLMQWFEPLTGKSKDERFKAIEEIAASASPRRDRWLQAILEGDLYRIKKEQRLVFGEKVSGSNYSITDADTDELIGEIKKRKLKKIALDNRMRSQLRTLINTFVLEDENPAVRLAAVKKLIGSDDENIVQRVRELLETEQDTEVAENMRLLVNLVDLKSDDPELKRQALAFVDGNISTDVVNALRVLSSDNGNPEVAAQAQDLLTRAEQKISMYRKMETVFFGLSLGSVLVIAAIGLAITFGVMGVINMAHGELIMLGAYTTYFVQQLMPAWIDYSLILAVPAAFLVSGACGVIIERTVIRHLYGRPLETLLATFGISLLLQQLVRTGVSAQNVTVVNPSWMSGSWAINPALSLTLNRLYILLFCLVVFALLVWFLSRSRFGLQMRAVVQNRAMARAMGVRSNKIDMLTFGLGAGVAGVAGVALSQIGNVGPNLGQNYIIDSFMVVVFGGVGNLWGTLVAGMSLGVVNKFMEPWVGAVLAKIVVLVFIILFIQRRPQGLFPQTGRAVEA